MQHVQSMPIVKDNIYSSGHLKSDLKSMAFSSNNKLLMGRMGRTAGDISMVLRQWRHSKYRKPCNHCWLHWQETLAEFCSVIPILKIISGTEFLAFLWPLWTAGKHKGILSTVSVLWCARPPRYCEHMQDLLHLQKFYLANSPSY